MFYFLIEMSRCNQYFMGIVAKKNCWYAANQCAKLLRVKYAQSGVGIIQTANNFDSIIFFSESKSEKRYSASQKPTYPKSIEQNGSQLCRSKWQRKTNIGSSFFPLIPVDVLFYVTSFFFPHGRTREERTNDWRKNESASIQCAYNDVLFIWYKLNVS